MYKVLVPETDSEKDQVGRKLLDKDFLFEEDLEDQIRTAHMSSVATLDERREELYQTKWREWDDATWCAYLTTVAQGGDFTEYVEEHIVSISRI